MSRAHSLSPAAIRAMFSTESEDNLITLLNIKYGLSDLYGTTIYIADSYTHKYEYINDTSMKVTYIDDINVSNYYNHTYNASENTIKEIMNANKENSVYGVVAMSKFYIFVPFEIILPSEEQDAAPRANLVISDITRTILPILRSISYAPTVDISLVLTSSTSTVEANFPGFKMGAISYTSDSISAELLVESLSVEPFPSHAFTPAYFPGLF